MKSRIVLLGPPASGKGTQADMIHARYGNPLASPGAILRNERVLGTALGVEADKLTSQGKLVADNVIVEVVSKWLENHSAAFVFDGFPRTLGQAEAIDGVLGKRNQNIDVALCLEVDIPTLISRILNRLVCPRCGQTVSLGVHVFSPDSPCPKCAGPLIRRSDDNLETFEHRMSEYREKTLPVIDYYQRRAKLHEVNSTQSPEQVFESISKILEAA